MMKTRVSFTGNLSLARLVKIAMSDNYHVVKADKDGIQMCSHQGHEFMPDGTYIAVHAFRMREQTRAGVNRYNAGLIDVRIDEDPEDKGRRLSVYITLNY